MKIIGPEILQKHLPGSAQTQKVTSGAPDFNHLLKENLAQPDHPKGGIQKTATLSEPQALQQIGLPSLPSDSLVDKTSRVIDLMDMYSKSLSDPGKTLKDIEPVLMTFIDEAQSLYEEFSKTDPDNIQLKPLVKDLLMTARLESVRFQRGDYLDSK